MSNDPHSVPHSKVLDFLRDIGLDPFDPGDIRSVHFDPGIVTVVRYRRNESGRQYIAGGSVATETTVLRWEDCPPEPAALDVTVFGDTEPQYLAGYQ